MTESLRHAGVTFSSRRIFCSAFVRPSFPVKCRISTASSLAAPRFAAVVRVEYLLLEQLNLTAVSECVAHCAARELRVSST